MKLWQKIYMTALLLFLPVLNVGLFMGARRIFDYNIEAAKDQASDEVHMLCHTIVRDIESLPGVQQLREGIVEEVSQTYIDYMAAKDSSVTVEISYVDVSEDVTMGQQLIQVYMGGDSPILYVTELLETPYEGYQLYYTKPLDDFYQLWEDLKTVFMVISLSCSIVLALILYLLLYELTYPLFRLSTEVERMRRGEPWQPVEVEGKDDIALLTERFNEMAEEIQAQLGQLQKENEIKQQLVDDVAHELRTPLTAIYGYAEYLEKARCSEEERLEALEYIMMESKRLSHMGQELLTMAIFREDELNREEIDADGFVKDISNMLEGTLRERRIRLQKNVGVKSFVGDRGMLICLVRNLIENAARASESGSTIQLYIWEEKDSVCLAVQDHGIGMEEQELERITDAFYRVDKARSRSNGGAGIGLSLCELIVRKHGGIMEFESQVGVGTTVTVTLPVSLPKEVDEDEI
ncbi:MAG: HAMP domain-containing histidine kinase [Lachnospiraceae bacterium]|nr:HAMP domain-containing histidine kinase [Lachnospiraceae bacterium]